MCRFDDATNQFEDKYQEIIQSLKASEDQFVCRQWVINALETLYDKYNILALRLSRAKIITKSIPKENGDEAEEVTEIIESEPEEEDEGDAKAIEESGEPVSGGGEEEGAEPGVSGEVKKKKKKKKKKKNLAALENVETVLEEKDEPLDLNANNTPPKKRSSHSGKRRKPNGIRKVSKQRREEIRKYYIENKDKGTSFTVKHFREKYGICSHTLSRIVKRIEEDVSGKPRARIGRPPLQLPQDQHEKLIQTARDDMSVSLRELARRFGITKGKVARMLKAAGIKRFTPKEIRVLKCNLKGQEYKPFYPPNTARKILDRKKQLRLEKKGLIPPRDTTRRKKPQQPADNESSLDQSMQGQVSQEDVQTALYHMSHPSVSASAATNEAHLAAQYQSRFTSHHHHHPHAAAYPMPLVQAPSGHQANMSSWAADQFNLAASQSLFN